ncbi:DUF2905 domain-containing protein [Fulvivirga sp. 29W222]|uniref:DUF2905 domain-containing protein n=1 Tax=Fulvivirga marina TaxID=2494733 RepID=A0A937FX12_9BACT|nr:DUF2905 domain-containing protein [Fulvivirga marina]MBL6446277.1 DUF2905 domain-containing protein [Fulvivirga marina]
MGKSLIIVGLIIVAVGLFLHFGPKIPYLGKLPGDISIKREGFQFYFPLMTSIILSILISVIIYFIQKLKG